MAQLLGPKQPGVSGRGAFVAILLFALALVARWNVAFVLSSPDSRRNNSTLPSTRGSVHNTSYIPLPLPNVTSPPISFGACCGIGHRLGRNIPTAVYAVSQGRPLHARWTDVKWSVVFNDTAQIQVGPRAKEAYENGFPANWAKSPLAYHDPIADGRGMHVHSEAYKRYEPTNHILFEMPLAHSVVKSLSDNLSPLVLSFLEPMRTQYASVCTSARTEGNNETGDWEGKTWRHISLTPTLRLTLAAMRTVADETRAKKVSVFVASDTPKSRRWFEENAPSGWHVVKPARELPRPENGVWFGEHGSQTGANLSTTERNEAMAEAVADVFALGECDALFIPNYSSFSVVGVMLTRAERRRVFFQLNATAFVEYPAS